MSIFTYMKAILIVSDKTLKEMFQQLSMDLTNAQSQSLTEEIAKNVPKDKYFIFQRESLYDIEPDSSNPLCYKLDFTFKIDNEDSQVHTIPISLSKHLFVKYKDLNINTLQKIDEEHLDEILEYAKENEDYDTCILIRDYLK